MASIGASVSPLLSGDFVEKLKKHGISTGELTNPFTCVVIADCYVLVVQLVCSPPDLVARGSGQPLSWAKKLQQDLLARFGPHGVSGRTLLKEAEESLCIFPFGEDVLIKCVT